MINFNLSIAENRRRLARPFLAAHRGICGANIPCNSLAAYKIALDTGADVVEIDVSKSKDGVYFIFHPGMERKFIGEGISLPDMTAKKIKKLRLLNSDGVPTSYPLPTLAEALELLKDKAYINVDKFWNDVEGISAAIRRAGVEKQVIVKTYTDGESLDRVAKYAPDFMFMPMVNKVDEVTDALLARGVNIIGTEILFDSESDPVISREYIDRMHERGLLIWTNAIVYNEKAVISAYHTDDISLTDSPERGWGWLADRGADFIQTDWLAYAKVYFESKK
jgi:glycerophosphoryl diester phosphodiesterase